MVRIISGRARMVFILAGLILAPVVIGFSPLLAQRLFLRLDLSGDWDYCLPASGQACHWIKARAPGKLTSVDERSSEPLLLRKRFESPRFCLESGAACELLAGTISDPADVYLNGIHIGRVGEPPPSPQYAQTYPGRFFIAASALRHGQLNELVMKLYPMKLGDFGVHGVTRGPLAIYTSRASGFLSESLTAGTVFLPLFSSFGLLTLVALSFLAGRRASRAGQPLSAYMHYCLVAGIYLISLSRLPREYLPQPIGFTLHFGFRFLLECFLLSFVANFFGNRSQVTKVVQLALIVISLLCFSMSFNLTTGQSWVTLFSSWGVLLCPYTAGLGLWLSLRSKSSQEGLRSIRFLFLFLFLMQCWDVMALRGVMPDIYFGRFSPLIIGIFFGRIFWHESVADRQRIEVGAKLGALATQVAHDVRSPLAALSMVAQDLAGLPEEQRLIVRSAINRIQDIATSLLDQNRGLTHATAAGKVAPGQLRKRKVLLLSSLIEEVVTEKRMQYRARIGISIESNFGAGFYGLFANVEEMELKRIVSNLINNSVEAVGDKGSVIISLSNQDGQICISLADNGKGIPAELIARLGQRGETHGKVEGSGLGLYHARTQLEDWSGILVLSSTFGQGTTVKITLPSVAVPPWFVEQLTLAPHTRIVVLDDDTSIHQIWDGRSAGLPVDAKIQIFHLSTPNQFREFVRSQSEGDSSSNLYLMDFELIGFKETGLSLIEELGLVGQAILVTSRYEDERVQCECARLGVKLIPKGMAGFVPLQITLPRRRLDAVLLDDDSLVHLTWRNAARRAVKAIQVYSTPDALFGELDTLDLATAVYIDESLGHGVSGLTIARQLYDRGFKKIFLATGYSAERFGPQPWLSGIVGKDPPFEFPVA